MVYCFAYNCTNGSSSGKSTFAFPPNTPLKRSLRKRWIAACNKKKEDIESAKNPRLCEDHFEPESFQKIPPAGQRNRMQVDFKTRCCARPKTIHKSSSEFNFKTQYIRSSDCKWQEKKKSCF